MKQKLFTLFVALVATTALWAQNNVITYAATEKLIETTDNYSSGLHTNAFNVAISSHAFSHGTGTITFAGDVTTIGNYAFYYCSGLTSITIPNSVTTIGDWAFIYCDGLTSVTIPNSVTTIGKWAFYGCSGLTSVTIGNSVTTIGNSAFENCVGLTKTNYTGTIADWCKISFDGPYANPICYSFNLYINDVEVKDLVIPNSVTTIGNYAFYGCSGLTSITIPNSVTMIGERAFYNVNNVVYDGTASGSPWGAKCINGYVDGYLVYSDASKTTLCGCSSAAIGEITLPNSVTTIENDAFLSCSGLTSVTIPNSVTTIGYEAFAYCTGLTSVTIPNSVTTILVHAFLHVNNIIYSGVATCTYGKYWGAKCMNGYIEGFLVYSNASKTALCGCSSAATGEITLPYSVTTIGEYAFENCSSLTSVTIPNSVTTIGNSAFSKCSGLTSVTIPNSVTTIGIDAFSYCIGLTSVTIPNSVTTIGIDAFAYCRGLTSVTIPNSVTTIGEYAFAYCRGLTSVIFAEKSQLTTIGNSAFSKCSGLTSVTIPNSVTEIGYGVFSYCSDLTSVTIPNSVTEIGERAFMDCSSLTSVTIPNSVKTIGEYAFYGCSSLTSITIGNSVTTIGEDAFYGCYGLTSVVIPSSVTTIGNKAFYNVQTITIPNWIKSLGYEWLGGSYRSEENTVYVVISPFEYDNNPENLNVINPIIKSASYHATLIPQLAEVATWTTTPTTIEMDIDLTNIPTTQLYDSISIDYFGEENDIEKILTPSTKNHVIFTGLTPNQKANIYYTSKKIGEDDWEEGAKLEIQLPKLNFTTLVPKVVSAGTAVVAAETNISDYETNVGFEWRKYDAPESMPSKSGSAILYNGMMEGKLLNLGTDSYWNVRPYYEAADGTRYYGEWITFDPSDFSYFEPTVHTYALATSPTANKVQVRGYVMTGTDDVTEQGFEYWFKGGQKAPHRIPNATADSVYRVTASGQVMTAVLEDLAYSSTYTCRAYAIAGGKTYYGEEVQFLTPEDPRPIYTLTVIAGENGSVNTEVSGQYREGEQVTLIATPNVGYQFEQWSDGNTENPYIFTIMQNTEITATFKQSESGLINLRSDIKATKYLHNGVLIIERNGIKYTPTGQKVK